MEGRVRDAKAEYYKLSGESHQQIESLNVRLDAVVAERDTAIAAELATRKESALGRLDFISWFQVAGRKPKVTIRWIGHGSDYALVQQIEQIINEHLHWAVELDGSNQPSLRPDPKNFKVMFETGHSQLLGQIPWAFDYGKLLGVSVGQRIGDGVDADHLIVEVLPSRGTVFVGETA